MTKTFRWSKPTSSSRKKWKIFRHLQNFEVEFQKRDKLRDFLNKNGVRTIIQWNGSPVHHFKKLGFGKYKFKHLKRTDLFLKMLITSNESLLKRR